MAIWQMRLALVPASLLGVEALRSGTAVLPANLPSDDAWWRGVTAPEGLEGRLDRVLPRAASWSDGMCIWGDEQGDALTACYDEGGALEWLGVKIDARRVRPDLVVALCQFADSAHAFFLAGRRCIPPDPASLNEAIQASFAWKYVQDPVGALKGLGSH